MSLNIKVNTQSFNREEALKEAQKEQNQKGKNGTGGLGRKTLYAGNTALAQDDLILAKKIQAQKQALKDILDQHVTENKFSESLEELSARREELAEEAGAAQKELATVQEMRKAYQEEHGVTEDTPEELIPKDEAYTEAMKQFDEMEEHWAGKAEAALNGRASLGKAISSMEIEHAKTHGMVDATKEAEKLLQNTSKEIVGMLQQEAVDHVDEEIEKTVEEAKDQAEEKKEQEEKLEAAKESKEEREQQAAAAAEAGKKFETAGASAVSKPVETAGEISEQVMDADEAVKDIQKKVKNILEEENLLAEDLKGIAVDAAL